MGYVGPLVVNQLHSKYPEAEIIGYDMGYFTQFLTGAKVFPELKLNMQYFGDVREIPKELFDGLTSVVHLAAISNDPMGNEFLEPTFQINALSTVEIARKARDAGAKSFVFASSCSMYGADDGISKTEDAKLNPLTEYARSKVYSERELEKIATDSFTITSLRFATACGMSDRLRLDLVLNDFVASAVTTKKIMILSDGTPWRPLIHVKDMARAIDWAIGRPSNGNNFIAVNAGRDDWNYQVKELAIAVADAIPGVEILINKDAAPDKRSYKVNFDKFKSIAPKYQPQNELKDTIAELKNGLEKMCFNNSDFRNSMFMRLKILKSYIENNLLDSNLRWKNL